MFGLQSERNGVSENANRNRQLAGGASENANRDRQLAGGASDNANRLRRHSAHGNQFSKIINSEMVILTPITINNHFNNANYVTNTFNFLLKKVDFRALRRRQLTFEGDWCSIWEDDFKIKELITMDIKGTIGDLASKITGDASLKEKFDKDPMGTVKELAGNIPPEQLSAVTEGIKTKVKLDNIGGSLGGLFGRK